MEALDYRQATRSSSRMDNIVGGRLKILVGLAGLEGVRGKAAHPPAVDLQLSDRLRHDFSTILRIETVFESLES